ncbi:MAG: CRISPR system precrRNA processing endoribonuclease RAMP protein Cas6 [Crenarchaeota archaeon]|nr:CRISPR system precrRNA processing endoribonuclease RAMP protein Cas6 [Thermoproteota archaeon]
MRLDVYAGRVSFKPRRRILLRGAWSGVYSGKIVYDALQGAGVVVEKGGFFRVSPLKPVRGPEIAAGQVLLPGARYSFNLYIWDIPGRVTAANIISSLTVGLSMLKDVIVEEVNFSKKTLTVPHPEKIIKASEEGDPCASVYVVNHGPTFYRFHGAIINYPSPRRMLASIARRLTEITTISYRKAASTLAEFVELYRFKVRRERFTISHGTRQPIFFGTARYYIVAPRPLVEAFEQLLEAAKLLGLGGGPGIGMGEVRGVKRVPPPPRLPPPVTPCYEEAVHTEEPYEEDEW